ncbi:hypothetical protein GCM10012275_36050 [Longimycelium tulufanense]|uniref:Uncharacterized protein n=1 Tax=Longimycelium tulufanense TaxID=907463 RepID=A0A8J3C9U4_9PSEU|nr:hypothetical protein GCM10012275_36050 [Longimycelium tulufanense]
MPHTSEPIAENTVSCTVTQKAPSKSYLLRKSTGKLLVGRRRWAGRGGGSARPTGAVAVFGSGAAKAHGQKITSR